MRRSHPGDAVEGRLGEHRRGQFGLGDNDEIGPAHEVVEAQQLGEHITGRDDAPADGGDNCTDAPTRTGTTLARRVDVRSIEELMPPERTVGERLREGGGESRVLSLNWLQIRRDGEDRVKPQ